MKYKEIDSRDKLASYIREIKNNFDFFYKVSKVYNWQENNFNNGSDILAFSSYVDNAQATINELGWMQVLNKLPSNYYDSIVEAMALYQWGYTESEIQEHCLY